MEKLNDWIKAGKMASEAREYGRGLIKEGESLLEVTEKIEAKIRALGGNFAFPVQISRNHIAAHYCSDSSDKTIFENGDMAKLDLGIEINGCISDTACTVYLGDDPKMKELVQASKDALDAALKIIRNGVSIGEIGAQIQNAITKYGFSPIKNLSGHGLADFDIHSEPSIPNFATSSNNKLFEQVVAIEPFATTGAGMVVESPNASVFSIIERKPIRDIISRKVLSEIDEYNGLPFAKRWLEQKFPSAQVNFALRQLINAEIIGEYPPLSEVSRGMVSQAEHTVIVSDKVIVTTL
ncbi:MAG: type II methionyl aminopeptidase [Candidatus Woesearchaeota archaeon]|nr:type II methionyl aminopeptidase [Candidatus Woesearchaeota archaeon]